MTPSVHLVQITQLERFDLALARLASPIAGIFEAPLVDGWLQIEIAVRRSPTALEEVDFFKELRALVAPLKAKEPGLQWFLLHKPPGLKIRFRVGAAPGAINTVAAWALTLEGWIEFAGFGSFFDQAELRPLAFRDEADALIDLAADALLETACAGQRADCAAWAQALAALALRAADGDAWLTFELLARLRRLRSGGGAPPHDDGPPPWNPRLLIERAPPPSPGFAASVSYLQALNLILNLWGVSPKVQIAALERAVVALQPELMT